MSTMRIIFMLYSLEKTGKFVFRTSIISLEKNNQYLINGSLI